MWPYGLTSTQMCIILYVQPEFSPPKTSTKEPRHEETLSLHRKKFVHLPWLWSTHQSQPCRQQDNHTQVLLQTPQNETTQSQRSSRPERSPDMRTPVIRKQRNCNNCARLCGGDVIRTKRGTFMRFTSCYGWITPKGGFTFAELLLEHPQSTHDTLSSLPFEVNLNFVLRSTRTGRIYPSRSNMREV